MHLHKAQLGDLTIVRQSIYQTFHHKNRKRFSHITIPIYFLGCHLTINKSAPMSHFKMLNCDNAHNQSAQVMWAFHLRIKQYSRSFFVAKKCFRRRKKHTYTQYLHGDYLFIIQACFRLCVYFWTVFFFSLKKNSTQRCISIYTLLLPYS